MKSAFRKLFSPLLNHFEAGEGEYHYRKTNRTILKVVGILFLVLSAISFTASLAVGTLGAIIPVAVFLGGGLFCLIIGALGNDRAVARVWGNK